MYTDMVFRYSNSVLFIKILSGHPHSQHVQCKNRVGIRGGGYMH